MSEANHIAQPMPDYTHLQISEEPQEAADLVEQFAALSPHPDTLVHLLADVGLLSAPEIEGILCGLHGEQDSNWRDELVARYGFPREAVQRAQALSLGLPYVDPNKFRIERDAINAVPVAVVREHALIPLCFTTGGLIIAIEDPDNAAAREALTFNTEHAVEVVISNRDAIELAITSWYGPMDDRDGSFLRA